jgi:hypothetical protein
MSYSSLSQLKESSSSQLSKFQEMIKKSDSSAGGYGKNDSEWTCFWDKEKKLGSATVRFLPAAKGSDFPWVKMYRHAFKGPTGKWYIENSLTTISKEDPVGQLNSRLWNSGVESDKSIARDQKRQTSYYANVLVIKDPAKPENEGKVKVYRFGAKVFNMIQDAMNPQFEDEQAVNPFNPWEGADFVIKMHEADGYPNYSKSYFKDPEAISQDDDAIEKLCAQCTNVDDYLAERSFKSYDELQNRMYVVLGPDVGSIETLPKDASTPAQAPRKVVDNTAKTAEAPAETASSEVKVSSDDDFDIDSFLNEEL